MRSPAGSPLSQRLQELLTALVAVLPLVALLIPTRLIERHPAPCLFTALAGVRCPGCGMTRAVSCAIHGRFRDAIHYNPLVVIVLPLAAFEWLQFMRRATKESLLPS
jgi:hypothetical protein